jgi:hypothetical protein
MMKVAASECVLQFGGEETGIDRQGTHAQWVMTEDSEVFTEIVTTEAGGVLVSGTAEEAKEHVKLSWERGQRAIEVLRTRLPEELRGVLVPLRKGGVNFCKLMSTMNETCSAARLAATKVRELKEEAGVAHHGLEGWAASPDSEKMCRLFVWESRTGTSHRRVQQDV